MKFFKNKWGVGGLVILALFFTASCQDHHWVPYDETKALPEPGSKEALEAAAKNREAEAGNQQFQIPAPIATGFRGTIASGTINLASGLSNETTSDWTLYVIARPPGGGAPLAATKAVKVTFPFTFRLDERNVMVGSPAEGMKLKIEAMLDSDGDPITKSDKDLFGRADGEPLLGTENITITLKKKSG